jgi:hypothetical protein
MAVIASDVEGCRAVEGLAICGKDPIRSPCEYTNGGPCGVSYLERHGKREMVSRKSGVYWGIEQKVQIVGTACTSFRHD